MHQGKIRKVVMFGLYRILIFFGIAKKYRENVVYQIYFSLESEPKEEQTNLCQKFRCMCFSSVLFVFEKTYEKSFYFLKYFHDLYFNKLHIRYSI